MFVCGCKGVNERERGMMAKEAIHGHLMLCHCALFASMEMFHTITVNFHRIVLNWKIQSIVHMNFVSLETNISFYVYLLGAPFELE